MSGLRSGVTSSTEHERVTNHGNQITVPACLRAQNTKPIFGVVVGDALDEPGQHFLS